jgi:uncharacterized protein (DUF2147 family)
MWIKKTLLAACITTLITGTSISFAAEKLADLTIDSPVGYWKTIDDITGKPKSIVKVWRNPDQMLMAKVIKIFPSNNSNQNKLCTACEGDKHNQPIVGMVIMSGLKSTENQWANGHILDPENGKTYKCSARLTEHGKKMNVHGYVGLPLFGRSQTWERVDLMSG